MEKWEGKVAVVTGASCGIGEAIVKDFARHGINVVGLARRSELIDAYAKKSSDLKGKIYAHKCDVSDLESVKSAFKWIEEKFSVIHILVNNAAILYSGGVLDDKNETNCVNVINTNLIGAVHCVRAGVKLIMKSEDFGIVVNVASILGHYVTPTCLVNMYSPSKFGLRAFSEVLRHELNHLNNKKIRVTNLSPGAVETEMIFKVVDAMDGETTDKEEFCLLKPQEVAQTTSFLLELPYNVNVSEMTIRPVGEKF